MTVRAVGLSAPARARYRDYTQERLVAEGKAPPPTNVEQHTAVSAPPATIGGEELYNRLVARFGMGEDPKKREAMYRRLVRLVSQKPSVIAFVYEAADKASAARQPDRYFSAAVVRLLRGSWEVFEL